MEYRYAPKPQNKKAALLVSLTAALGLLSIIGSMTGWGRQSLWQSAALLFICAALFFWLRYLSIKYVYTITDAYGAPMLIVTSIQGKRISTLCRMDLYRLSSIERIEDAESEEGKAALARFRSAAAKYSYMMTIAPKRLQILYGQEAGQSFAIRIEADEDFLSALSQMAAEGKRKKEEEPDDE